MILLPKQNAIQNYSKGAVYLGTVYLDVIVVVFIYCFIFFYLRSKNAGVPLLLFVCLFYQISKRSRWVILFVFEPIRLSMSLEKSISALLIGNLFVVIHTYDVGMKTRPKGHIVNKLRPRLCGSSLDFEFIRECMKITKIRPWFHFLKKKNGNKNDTPCGFVLLFTAYLLLQPLGSLVQLKILNVHKTASKWF